MSQQQNTSILLCDGITVSSLGYAFLNLNVYNSKHGFIRNHQSQFMQRTDSSFMVESACQSVTQLGIAEEQVGDKLGSLILKVTGNIQAEICSKSQVINKRIGGTKYIHLRSTVFKTAPVSFERSMLVSELLWRSVLLLTTPCICLKAEGSFQVSSSAELAARFCFIPSPYSKKPTTSCPPPTPRNQAFDGHLASLHPNV